MARLLWEMKIKKAKKVSISMQILSGRAETDNLGQQVSYPQPGYHMTVGKDRMRQFPAQMSLFILFTPLLHLFSDIIFSLSDSTFQDIFFHEMCKTAQV